MAQISVKSVSPPKGDCGFSRGRFGKWRQSVAAATTARTRGDAVRAGRSIAECTACPAISSWLTRAGADAGVDAPGDAPHEPVAQAPHVDVQRVFAQATPATNWLSLIGASLRAFPTQISTSTFPVLTQLYLGHNALETLPPALFQMQSLRGLFLQNNHIARVPLEIGQLTDLQELYLSSNRLHSVPSTLTNLQALDCLWLDDNKMLPSSIAHNCSRNRKQVQALISRIAEFYGPRFTNAQRAVLFFIMASTFRPPPLLRDMPREIVCLIVDKVWASRHDAAWAF